MATNGTITPGAGEIARQEFGSQQLMNMAETSATAIAEREKATIQAMFIMAERKPREVAKFSRNLLLECDRPGFAEVARYRKPAGNKKDPISGEWVPNFAEGFSIRFAEAALRNWTNVFCDSKIVYEDDQKRIVRFMVIDLENNIPLSSEIQLGKTVERKGKKDKRGNVQPPEGREVHGERLNSYGDKVFIVAATEDELGMKQASAWSKFIRNVLRFMPGDILDSALERIEETLKKQVPQASAAKMVTKFDALGISVADLQAYIGHALSDITHKDLDELRGVYTAIKDGETTWADVLEAKQPSGSSDAAKKAAEEKLAELKKQAESAGGAAAPKTDPDPEVPSHVKDLMSYREKIGDADFYRIVKKHGFATPAEVPENIFMGLVADMEEVIAAKKQSAKDAAKDKPKFAGFGGK